MPLKENITKDLKYIFLSPSLHNIQTCPPPPIILDVLLIKHSKECKTFRFFYVFFFNSSKKCLTNNTENIPLFFSVELVHWEGIWNSIPGNVFALKR